MSTSSGSYKLAEWLNLSPPVESSSDMKDQVGALRTAYAFAATRRIIDKAAAFAERLGKNLMFVLNLFIYGSHAYILMIYGNL